jgi:NADPH:quinone reductase-like Zn-dependent oxidoreductase
MLVTITVFSGVEETAKKHGMRGVAFIVKPSRLQLIELGRLIDKGELHPVVEEVLPLPEARRAFEKGSGGHTRGKLVLRVAESATARA